ncbi:MAG TPA: hypothetical protein ENN29_00470 [Candidatus Hydrogenedentes bacterium]|nr:hypothetical protein [Candidatus Hydrogenedentota bacterium]
MPDTETFLVPAVGPDSPIHGNRHSQLVEAAIGIGVHFLRLPLFALFAGALFFVFTTTLALTQRDDIVQSGLIRWLAPAELMEPLKYSGGISGLLLILGKPFVNAYGWVLLIVPFGLGLLEYLVGRHIRDAGPPMYVKFGLVAAYVELLWIYALRAMPFEADAAKACSAMVAVTALLSFTMAIASLMGLHLLSLFEEMLIEGYNHYAKSDA